LFFSDPGTHIDATRSIVRVMRPDALPRYAANLVQSAPVLSPDVVQRIVNLLTTLIPKPADAVKAVAERRDAFSLKDVPEEKKPRPAAPKPIVVVEKVEPNFFKRLAFSRRQWAILFALAVVAALLLIALIVLAYVASAQVGLVLISV
jgi:hypothetical protein